MTAWHVLLLLIGFSANYSIPSASMQPTLNMGEVYELPSIYLYRRGPRLFTPTPQTGDIVVFLNRPTGEYYVKRVIGVAGDRIRIRQGRLLINGVEVERSFKGYHRDTDSFGTMATVARYMETLPNGVTHEINEVSDAGPLDNTAEIDVPTGQVFVMGDNRDRSADSRAPGQVPMPMISDIVAMQNGSARVWSWGSYP